MAGNNELNLPEIEDSFQWDEQSQLYYHASSGFYHDPAAGWYYNTKDGLYYKFEDGNYVLWETDQADQVDVNKEIVTVEDNSVYDESYNHVSYDKDTNDNNVEAGECEGSEAVEAIPSEPIVDKECLTNEFPENLRPPSEWLEDTLIELYLSGYSNPKTDGVSGATTLDDYDSLNIPTDGAEEYDNADELEEGEWVPDENHEVVDGCEVASDEDEEEMWRAQYGQPVLLDKETVPDYPVVDLWDWSMVTETKKNRKKRRIRICKLIGRLVKRSSKLHPSLPTSGHVLKTAPICEVHLDLARVRSGRVYKLRSPKATYLASLSSYDSSNPTKDWGFPKLSMEKETETFVKYSQHIEHKREEADVDKVGSVKEILVNEKHKEHTYRDRAAARRKLHGGFGVGPGQKRPADDCVDSESSSPVSGTLEEAAAEAMHNSFGVGSYARKILESMGWKEGEALGSSMKGLMEPLQAIGNKGNSGLGWNQNSNRKQF